MQIQIPFPVSGGILLSYKCTTSCKHCMYACSRKWKGDWIKKDDLETVLDQLAGKIEPCFAGKIGINCGLHFTGGEPFMNFRLLAKAVKIASDLGIPSLFVETNCFWCKNDEITAKRLEELKDSGLDGILISVNPFIAENVPFERTDRCIRLSRKIFENAVIVYQEIFYRLFKEIGLQSTLSLENAIPALRYAELLPMGRVPYKLGHLFRKYPANAFFGQSCRNELLRRWHIHIDNYCNFVPGYCGGITLGDARDLNSNLANSINLEEKPILKALLTDIRELFELGKKFGYSEKSYISKCHLCVDVRRHLTINADFEELRPLEFYTHLED